MSIEIRRVDYNDQQQGQELVDLLNGYAQDPMGGAEALSESTQANLVNALKEVPHAFSFIAYVDGKPAGLINCFEGFSTFKCKPIINIHDVTVQKAFRGLGISHAMLEAVQAEAKHRGACKLTLEVLEGNTVARHSYESFGFAGYELDPAMGKAEFWEKAL